jgi:hypothetical protein
MSRFGQLYAAEAALCVCGVPMKAAGGKWDSKAKLWRAPYGAIKGTVLEERIQAGYRKVKAQ